MAASAVGQGADSARVHPQHHQTSECTTNMERGDWLEAIAEPLVRGLVSQLKAEYQMEFRRAMKASTEGDLLRKPAATAAAVLRIPSDGTHGTQSNVRYGVMRQDSGGSAESLASSRRDLGVSFSDGAAVQPTSPGRRSAGGDTLQPTSPGRRSAGGDIPRGQRMPKGRKSWLSRGTSGTSWGEELSCGQSEQASQSGKRRRPGVSRANSSSCPSRRDSRLGSQDSITTLQERDIHRLQDEMSKIVNKEGFKKAKKKSDSRTFVRSATWIGMLGGTRSAAVPDVPEGTPCWRAVPHRAVMWPGFDMVMGIVIILNAITIGIETSAATTGSAIPTFALVSEYVFLFIYIVELAMRFNAMGVRGALRNGWVRLDGILVLAGIMNFGLSVTSAGGTTAKTIAGNFSMLKLLRLARLARTVRLVVQFRTLWLLCSGLIYAVMPMIWTCFIMVAVIYVFAIAGMEIIGSNRDDALAVDEFGSLSRSMLFLLQTIFLDNSVLTWKPLVEESPLLIVYFVAFFLIGPIALMNIVTAIMVESSMRTATEDIEAKKAWMSRQRSEMVPKLYELFGLLDVDESGELDIEEFRAAPAEVKEQISRIVEMELFEEVFHLLDTNGDGSVDIEEFVDGIVRSWQEGTGSVAELSLLMRQMRRKVNDLSNEVQGALSVQTSHAKEQTIVQPTTSASLSEI